MSTLLSLSSIACGLLILAIIIADLLWRRNEVLSYKNIFLVGLLLFHCISGWLWASAMSFDDRYIPGDSSMALYAAALPIFLVVFVASAKIGGRFRPLTHLIPKLEIPVTSAGIIVSLGILTFITLALTLFQPTGFWGLMASQFRAGIAAVAAALATYLLIARRFNPAAWAIFGAVILLGLIAATIGGSGRRPMLGVLMAIPWMWYFIKLRDANRVGLAVRVFVAFAAALVMIAAYGAVRHDRDGRATVGREGAQIRINNLIDVIQNPQITGDTFMGMFRTDTAGNTMFIMETYPATYEHIPGHGIVFILSNPIPRIYWPEKPEALGIILRDQMNTIANLGPGIIGHGWAEGAWLGVIAYAIFFGIFVAVFDIAIRERMHNPFFIAAASAALGNVLGLPRGDTPLFLIQIAAALVSSFAILICIQLALRHVFAAFPPLLVPQSQPYRGDHDWHDDYADHVADEQASNYEHHSAAHTHNPPSPPAKPQTDAG